MSIIKTVITRIKEQKTNMIVQQAQVTEDIRKTWETVNANLVEYYGQDLYKNWLGKLDFLELQNNNHVVLAAPSDFIKDWIKSNYLSVIFNFFNSCNPNITYIDIITRKTDKHNEQVKSHSNVDKNDQSKNDTENNLNTEYLDKRFTFDNFVVGPPNQLAYAAAMAVAESDSAVTKSNPLFLYGGVGLGKTHLMHAISWHIHQKRPERKVLYISAEKFMYRFIKALRDKETMSFKEEFRSVDVLMIDDIQFICGKENTQEEFFHTFNAIIDNNKQMVISCDRSPSDLDNIEERIKSRLGWGLVADVHSTTYELRVGILELKLEKMNIQIPREVIDFLASKITSNVRELEGALNKVIAHSTLIGREVTLENTQEILRDLLRSNERIVTIEDIQKKICNRYNIKLSDMSSSTRLRSIARPRQIAMYLAKNLTSRSLADIGSKFAKKDHTTVMHAIKKVEKLMLEDPEVREEITILIKILQN